MKAVVLKPRGVKCGVILQLLHAVVNVAAGLLECMDGLDYEYRKVPSHLG